MSYNYIIVGSGFFGSICAYELKKRGFKVLVLEKRNHIGGNCYTSNKDGINIHEYGPHIFHTNNDTVWKWINKFVSFNNFTLRPVANYLGETYSLPFNMWTFSKIWNIHKPEDAINIIKNDSKNIIDPTNFEEQAIKLVGLKPYELLIKGYTKKQWGKNPNELPKEIIQRLPVRFTYDNNYFNDKYQGIPIGGYTQIFEKLLNGVEVLLNTDFFEYNNHWLDICDKVIYTGPIDEFYDYKFGHLEYKTTKFEHEFLNIENYQGTAMMNFTHESIPYTRIIEHKHFEFNNSKHTYITKEYPTQYIPKITDPMYPVNDEKNNKIYQQYKNLSTNNDKILFGGRLAEYKYYDMHQVIESALNFIKKEI